MTTVILVRHGQTEWNRIERFRGRYDVPLNEAGLAQAEAAARAIAARWPATAVYSSPLSRALATAEPIARALGVTVQAHPGLIDIDYGVWQGLTPAEVLSGWPEAADAWYRGASHAPIPGGEQLSAVGAAGAVCDARHRGLDTAGKPLWPLAIRWSTGRCSSAPWACPGRAFGASARIMGPSMCWKCGTTP